MKFEGLLTDEKKQKKEFVLLPLDILKNYLPKASIADKYKVAFYNELHMLLSSGIELSKAISLIKTQESRKKLVQVFEGIEGGLREGKSFGDTLNDAGGFTPYEIFSINAGEETRALPACVKNLESYFSRKINFKRQIISLLSYPAFVIFITLFVLYFMLSYVVPMFSSIFRQFGSELPGITKFVIKLSGVFHFILIGVFISFITLYFLNQFLKQKESYCRFTNNIILRIPIVGDLVKSLNLLKFTELMSLLLSARIPLLEALEMANKTTSLFILKENLRKVSTMVGKGYSLHDTLDKAVFNKKLLTLISIGEEVNQLDKVFENISVHLNSDIDFKVKMIGKVMEPLILVVISLIVGFILIAMYYPMFTLSRVIGN